MKTMLNRSTADFFAALASVTDLSSLEQWQKEKLVADARKADYLSGAIVATASLPTSGASVGKTVMKEMDVRLKRARKNKKFMQSWRGGEIPYQWLAIWEVHPFVRNVISQLADRGFAYLGDLPDKRLKPISIQAENGLLAYNVIDFALDGLFEILCKVIETPFSFLRCDLCKTIFVPASKKQKKYCSRECATKAVGLTPKRRKYMKDFMVRARLSQKIADVREAIARGKRDNPKSEELKQLKGEQEALLRREKELDNGN